MKVLFVHILWVRNWEKRFSGETQLPSVSFALRWTQEGDYSYSWQIHVGLASEGMMTPFRRNLAIGMIKRPWTQPAFWGALPLWLKSQPHTTTLQLLQQERFPRDWLWWRRACANLRWILSFIRFVFAEDVALWETGEILKLLKQLHVSWRWFHSGSKSTSGIGE